MCDHIQRVSYVHEGESRRSTVNIQEPGICRKNTVGVAQRDADLL